MGGGGRGRGVPVALGVGVSRGRGGGKGKGKGGVMLCYEWRDVRMGYMLWGVVMLCYVCLGAREVGHDGCMSTESPAEDGATGGRSENHHFCDVGGDPTLPDGRAPWGREPRIAADRASLP
jgi:hypothetical protein